MPEDSKDLNAQLEAALNKIVQGQGGETGSGGEGEPTPPPEGGEPTPPQELLISPDKLEQAKIRVEEEGVVKEIPLPSLLERARKAQELEMKLKILEEKAKNLETQPPQKKPEESLESLFQTPSAGGDGGDVKQELEQLKQKLQEIEQESMARKVEEFRQARMREAEAGLDAYPLFKENAALKDVAKLVLEGQLDARPDLDPSEIVGIVAKRLTEVAREREQRLLERAEKRRSLGGGPAPGQQTIKIPSQLTKEDLQQGKVRDLIEEVLRRQS